jgi:hypothetical protein
MSDTGGGTGTGTGEMTLAFALSAIERFADPTQVFADARTWSRYVGVIANDTEAVAAFVAEHDLQQDFDLGDRDKWLALAEIREATATDRHVFVGTTEDDRGAAETTGWEFITVHEAGEKAGWAYDAGTEPSPGVLGALRERLPSDVPWPFGESD